MKIIPDKITNRINLFLLYKNNDEKINDIKAVLLSLNNKAAKDSKNAIIKKDFVITDLLKECNKNRQYTAQNPPIAFDVENTPLIRGLTNKTSFNQ